jgi:hypothetical protein
MISRQRKAIRKGGFFVGDLWGEGIGFGLVGVRRYPLFAQLLKVSYGRSWAGVRQGRLLPDF